MRLYDYMHGGENELIQDTLRYCHRRMDNRRSYPRVPSSRTQFGQLRGQVSCRQMGYIIPVASQSSRSNLTTLSSTKAHKQMAGRTHIQQLYFAYSPSMFLTMTKCPNHFEPRPLTFL